MPVADGFLPRTGVFQRVRDGLGGGGGPETGIAADVCAQVCRLSLSPTRAVSSRLCLACLFFHHTNLPSSQPRRARETILARDATALTAEEAEEKAKAEAVKRKQEAHEMVAESIKRELAESTSSSRLHIVSSVLG